MRADGPKIVALWQRRGMTRDKLAHEAGLSLRTVQHIEVGRTAALETLNQVAPCLGPRGGRPDRERGGGARVELGDKAPRNAPGARGDQPGSWARQPHRVVPEPGSVVDMLHLLHAQRVRPW